jgi:[Skp1-protein]-hydroxyproline N-acetylglucosaminyltransferase
MSKISVDDLQSIFISVASFKDPECPRTILSAFKQAKNPYRVFIGVCQQNDDNDIDCVNNDLIKNGLDPELVKNNIIVKRIQASEAKGPTYARWLCSLLCNNEKYYLQIDSHIQFGKHWDDLSIEMVQRIKRDGLSQKPILSYYPKAYEGGKEVDDKDPHNVPRICKAFINDRKMVSYPGAETIQSAKRPTLSGFVAAGTFFCESTFINEVPYDPELPYLFVGEEILFSARMWTSGWDIFNFNANITYHYYTREKEPKFWDNKKTYNDSGAFAKVKYMLKMPNSKLEDVPEELKENINKYGLGDKRSIKDYWEFTGIDLENNIVTKDFCRNKRRDIILE